MKKTKPEWQYVGGEGIWREYKNLKTGQTTISSLGKLSEIPDSSNFGSCDHYWELTDPHSSSIQCQKCQLGKVIVWGKQIVREGKLITL